jgi:hypothetical protein
MIATYPKPNKILESQKRKQYASTSDTSNSARILALKTNTKNTIDANDAVTETAIRKAAPNNPIFYKKNAVEKKSATTAIRHVRAGGSIVPPKVTKAYLI